MPMHDRDWPNNSMFISERQEQQVLRAVTTGPSTISLTWRFIPSSQGYRLEWREGQGQACMNVKIIESFGTPAHCFSSCNEFLFKRLCVQQRILEITSHLWFIEVWALDLNVSVSLCITLPDCHWNKSKLVPEVKKQKHLQLEIHISSNPFWGHGVAKACPSC